MTIHRPIPQPARIISTIVSGAFKRTLRQPILVITRPRWHQ